MMVDWGMWGGEWEWRSTDLSCSGGMGMLLSIHISPSYFHWWIHFLHKKEISVQ